MSRRAGELIAEGQKDGSIASQGQPRKVSSSQTRILPAGKKPKTLGQLGVSYDQSSHWKELAGLPTEEFEEQLPLATHKRTSTKEIVKKKRPQPTADQVRQNRLETFALRIWGRVDDLPKIHEDEPLHDVVAVMDKQFLDGLTSSIPKARKFLEALEKDKKDQACEEAEKNWGDARKQVQHRTA